MNSNVTDLKPRLLRRHGYVPLVICAFLLTYRLTLAGDGSAEAQNRPQPVRSLADSLKRASATTTQLHIFYVHGMAAAGPGHSDSQPLRRSICSYWHDCVSPEGDYDGREYADKDRFALNAPGPQLSYLVEPVWRTNPVGSSSEEWNASAPFVDHWKIARKSGPTIYVDEINWWPLVFALKCRQIVANDASLAGPAAAYIDVCASSKPDAKNPGRYISYAWIGPSDASRLKAMPKRGALINRGLKNYILDWGFSDALIALGPERPLLLEGIRLLVLKSVKVNADGRRGDAAAAIPDQEFVVVSHSLGSYLMFSALDLTETVPPSNPQWKVEFERILGRTSIAYFLANQIRLFELAKLDAIDNGNMRQHLELWGKLRREYLASQPGALGAQSAAEIVAWSDPSDLLTWDLPQIPDVDVENSHVKNAIHWLWLFESPSKSHGNYDLNHKVIRVMLKPST